MTLEIVKNNAAENDLVDIWIYSFDKWGTSQADKYIDQLNVGLLFLADNPLVGIDCNILRKSYLSYPIKKHMVFYKIESKILRIIRVLGSEMDHREYIK